MKTLFFTITCITFVTLSFLPSSFAQKAAPEGMVRLIYFLPNDRPFRPEVVQKMKDEIRNLQTFFGEQMQAHGHGNKTFRIETDAQGEPIVHRVNGQHSDSHYQTVTHSYLLEIRQKFGDPLALGLYNIHFIVWDNSTGLIRGVAGWGGGSKVELTSEFSFYVAAHELGHVFGLWHDFRAVGGIMGGGTKSVSACAAEFLAVNSYFNPDIPFEWAKTTWPTIELISPRTYPPGIENIPIQLKVSDSDGLHQVILFAGGSIKTCRGLKGEKEAVVEFHYDGVIGSTSLLDRVGHSIVVKAVDVQGGWNRTPERFTLTEIQTESALIATLEGNRGYVTSVAFSPDGLLLASSAIDGPTKLWDVATKRSIATLERGPRGVSFVAFSPDGLLLVSSAIDGTIKLWDVATKRNIATLKGQTAGDIRDAIWCVAFSPDGLLLASGAEDGTIKLWDVATKRNIATLKGQTAEGDTDSVRSIAFSPDGLLLASGAYYGTITLWDVATKRNIATLEGDEGLVSSVAFSPDGLLLASSTNHNIDHTIKLWDVATKDNIATFDPLVVGDIAFSPDGLLLASSGLSDGTVRLWEVATSTQIATFAYPSEVWPVSFSPDGTLLASGTTDGTVTLWDMSSYITPITPPDFSPWDVNRDEVVNIQDLVLVASKFGEIGENSGDVNGDGVVNIADLVLVAGALGDAAAAPSAHPQTLMMLTAVDVQQWLIQAQQLSLTDARSQRGMHFLEHLLAVLTPKETALFANYPNPFNPETWIPYQLAEPASVQIAIYSADGKLVRGLMLGTQAAGVYQDKSRAAYWDGRNEVGEPVASGVYFYTLSAGDFTATRKMLIQK